MTGIWVFICGPSGVGKDSVITGASEALARRTDIVFARRLVTRIAQPGSDHDAVDEHRILSLQRSGGLSWHWQAYGFHYGISKVYATDINAGRVVVVNGSRRHVDGLPAYPDVKRVDITASPETIAARLAQRGRDSNDAVRQRLARNAGFDLSPPGKAGLTIPNDAEITNAGALLVAYLQNQACDTSPPARSRMVT